MNPDLPSATDYSSERARHGALEVIDIRAAAQDVAEHYKNQVMLNVNGECMRLSVFEGQYRWHVHPDTDELFVVVSGELRIEFEHALEVVLHEWQSLVVPAGTVHRTRAVGRTVNVTFEMQGAGTVFLEPQTDNPSTLTPLPGSA